MLAHRKGFRLAVAAGSFLLLMLLPMVASAQQSITPGATPEPAKDNWTYWLGWLVAPATLGLILLIGASYLRVSSRFFAKEEAPQPERRRPRYPTGAVAPPVGLGPRVEQMGAASTTPPAAPASEVTTAKEQEPKPTPAPTAERKAPAPAGTPAATAEAEAPAEKAPGTPPRDEPAEAPKAEAAAPAQAPAPAPAAAPQHVEPDQEVYERELKAQLDKGTDRRVAEGRAKAAAVRAAKAKAAEGGGEPTPPPEEEPRIPAGAGQPTPEEQRPKAGRTEEEQKEAAEASAQAQAKVTEPEVVEGPTPVAEAKQAEEPPREVEAPAPAAEAKEAPAEPAEAERPAAPPGGDEETFNRVLEDQLGKGLARPIAESRARAAAIKAAREKSGG